MSRFLNETMTDIRGGRESWRVFTLFGSLAFVISIALQVVI